jgi:hypothetical protein
MSEPLKIVAAAVLLDGGFILTAPPPARHHDLVARICEMTGKPFTNLDAQGFLLSNGNFCRRRPAAVIAAAAGQIEQPAHPPNLYSEDLW